MDEETEPNCGGSAYVATRQLLQAIVITALSQPALLSYGLSISVTHAITKCNTVWEL